MKEFVNKHPIVSLFMLDIVVTGVLNLACLIKNGKFPDDEIETTAQ